MRTADDSDTAPAAGDPARDSELTRNRAAWDAIGVRVATPYLASRAFLNAFEEFIDELPTQAHVLDLGCGPGTPFARYLVDRGYRVTGADFSATMIGAARERVPEATFVCCPMTELNFVDEFDAVFSSYSMLCLSPADFRMAAARAVTALKRGGSFFLALNEPAAMEDNAASLQEDTAARWCTIMGERLYARPYSEQEIRDCFAPLGMTDYKISREAVTSDEYGLEHMLVVLMRRAA